MNAGSATVDCPGCGAALEYTLETILLSELMLSVNAIPTRQAADHRCPAPEEQPERVDFAA